MEGDDNLQGYSLYICDTDSIPETVFMRTKISVPSASASPTTPISSSSTPATTTNSEYYSTTARSGLSGSSIIGMSIGIVGRYSFNGPDVENI